MTGPLSYVLRESPFASVSRGHTLSLVPPRIRQCTDMCRHAWSGFNLSHPPSPLADLCLCWGQAKASIVRETIIIGSVCILVETGGEGMMGVTDFVWQWNVFTLCYCINTTGHGQCNHTTKTVLQIRAAQYASFILSEAGVLDEPDSAKPAQRSSYTGSPGYTVQFQPM